MIVIVSKDKDFSHTLAEQLVRELGVACECVASASELKALKNQGLQLVISTDGAIKTGDIRLLALTLPVRVGEVLAQVTACLHSEGTQPQQFGGGFTLTAQQKTLAYAPSDKTIDLTDKETQLLLAMLGNKNGIDKEVLLKDIWGIEAALDTHTLETHIYRLRAKFKELSGSEMIVAIENGYKLA